MRLYFCRPYHQLLAEPETRYVGGWTLERFIRENLTAVMANRKFVGDSTKRIRKKRAKAFLGPAFRAHRWQHLGELMAAPIRERLDYASLGRMTFSVTPL